MDILDIRVMRGPNYWSITQEKIIVLKINLGKLEGKTPSDIEGFNKRLEEVIKTLNIDDTELLNKIKQGTTFPCVIAHLSVDIQALAGMPSDYVKVYSCPQKGVYNVIFSYTEEEGGKYAAGAAVRITESLINDIDYNIQEDIDELIKIKKREFLGLSTGSVVEEALKRGIPYEKAYDDLLIILGYGANQKRIQATISSHTSHIGVEIAGDKDGTKNILKEHSIPIPEGITIETQDELISAIKEVGYPLVTKPLDGNHGRGITINITSFEEALAGFKIAKEISEVVILEKYITGYDYRILLVDYKYVATVKRVPPSVKGNGKSTIQELIDELNRDPRRQPKPGNILQQIEVDEITLNILKKQELTLDSVLSKGEEVFIKKTGNVSSGAIPIDVTDELHPYNIFQAERIAKLVGLDICGIDVMSPDLKVPLNENGGAVIEVNAAPGIRMHIEPAVGKSRNVAGAIVDMLFPKDKKATIPIVAVTGTNGKTTVVRLIAHIAHSAGLNTGYTTTEGIYINEMLMQKGDCSGPQSAKYILKDNTVEFAVLECARGGILRSGLAFKNCDVGIVTNVEEDHLGLNDINNLEDMARVKSVIPRSVHNDGYAVLNADDDAVYGMSESVNSQVALFSMNSSNPRIEEHCKKGGLAAIIEEGSVVIIDKNKKYIVEKVDFFSFTHKGKAKFMVQNMLPAILAAYVQGFSIEQIKEGLKTFESSSQANPGRLNMFDFRDFKIMLDYAHNPAGLEAIGDFIKSQNASWNIGIITAPGDRRDEDIIKGGKIAAGIFDHIIIRDDVDLRGRTADEIHKLLTKGIKEGNPDIKIDIIEREDNALNYAVENARKNTLITTFSESPSKAIKAIERLQEEYQNVQKV